MRPLILLLPFLLLSLLPCSSMARTWHVPSEAPTIQAGIDSAGVGDTVLVGPGTYAGDGNRDIDFGGKEIVLLSESGPALTIIDCEGTEAEPHRGFYFHTGETHATAVQGFTIKNGYALWGGWWDYPSGGGIFCSSSSPTVMNCIFTGNNAQMYYEGIGGGLYCEFSSLLLVSCTFSENRASDVSYVEAIGRGGAVCCHESNIVVTDCVFSENSAATRGGGVACYWSSVTMTGCILEGNISGDQGGGFYCSSSSPTLTRCTFSENYASSRGGGLYGYSSSPVLVNCTLFKNGSSYPGGGLSSPSVTLDNTLIAFGTSGGAVDCGGAVVSCCDVYANAGGDWVGCIEDHYGVNGNISQDPLFCDPGLHDLHLHCQSPCAPAQQPDCGLIGALGVGCGPTATVPTTWGLVKSIFDLRGE